MKVGNRVKYSYIIVETARDAYLSEGREPHKSALRKRFEQFRDTCGTVTAILPSGIEVTEDSGAVHESLTYRWVLARD